MNFHLLALAAAATLTCSLANAATFGERFDPAKFTLVEAADGSTSGLYNNGAGDQAVGKVILLSGASASAKFLGTFVIEDNCDKATLSVLWNDATAGSSYRAYACDTKAGSIINGATIDSLLIIKRDTGGSIQGVNPVYNPARINFMKVGAINTSFAGATSSSNNCAAVALPAGKTAPDLNSPNFSCGSTTGLFSDAGFSDLEPEIIFASINGGSTLTPTLGTITRKQVFQQIFGVAANLKLYRALQASQGLTQDDQPANRPSLSSSFVSSALTGKLSTSATGKRGWGTVISAAVDANATTKQVNICRRAAGSGTQAGANAYFAANPCSSGKATPLTAAGAIGVTGTTTAVVEASSAGNVEACLTNIDDLAGGDAYGIGHLTRDLDPLANGGDKKYRYVKLDGAQPEAHPNATTGVCDFAGCQDAQSGKYNYVYESVMLYNSGTPGAAGKKTALDNIAAKAFLPATIAGNDLAVIAGAMALPTTYTGAYESQALGSAAQVYGSRVSRGASSCSPLTLAR